MGKIGKLILRLPRKIAWYVTGQKFKFKVEFTSGVSFTESICDGKRNL